MITYTDTALRWAYIGNFRPPHSTENHVASALERIGQTVTRWQEDEPLTWAPTAGGLRSRIGAGDYDIVLWTRTGWDWPHSACEWDHETALILQSGLLDQARTSDVPTVGFHLDRWWGLDREGQVRQEPFFRCDLVCTAEGDPTIPWAEAGVNHLWMPPGVLLAETEREPRPDRGTVPDVVWVGSWRTYHPEWLPYRQQLVRRLQRAYRRRVAILPKPGQSIRGEDLTDLYASAKVVVGDSCLAGGATHYWSDRIPETLGRRGVLVHPDVPGLRDHFPEETLTTYELGDFDGLLATIDELLADEPRREALRNAGHLHVQLHHTYERRMEQLLDALLGSGALR